MTEKNTENNTEKTPIGIVTLAPHIVEILYEIDAGEEIVGTIEYSDFPQQANNIPVIGGYHGLQIEKIVALNPDVIFAWRSGNKATDLEQLARLGFTIIYSNPSKIDNVASELRQFGHVLNKQALAEQAATNFEITLATIRQQYANKKPIKVFYQLWSQPMMTINKNTWIHQLVEICQGNNVFANSTSDYPQISIENVVVAKPELIIIADEKSKTIQPLIQWQKWPEIPAVKANAFIHVNADLLHRFSTRMLSGLDDMCSKIDNTRSALSDH